MSRHLHDMLALSAGQLLQLASPACEHAQSSAPSELDTSLDRGIWHPSPSPDTLACCPGARSHTPRLLPLTAPGMPRHQLPSSWRHSSTFERSNVRCRAHRQRWTRRTMARVPCSARGRPPRSGGARSTCTPSPPRCASTPPRSAASSSPRSQSLRKQRTLKSSAPRSSFRTAQRRACASSARASC